MGWIKNFIDGLKNYDLPVKPNFIPEKKVIPEEWYSGSSPWKYVVVHHSATADGRLNDWEGIRKYHTSYRVDGIIVTKEVFAQRQMLSAGKVFEKPWSDIGYHIGVEFDGGEVKVKLGRPWNKAGAHAGMHKNGQTINKFNEEAIGLCVVGDFDKAEPSPEVWSKAVQAVKELIAHFSIPKENVIGHREAYDLAGVPRQKTCPGSKFDMAKFREAL